MCYYVPLRETEEEKLLWVIMYYLKTFKKAPAKKHVCCVFSDRGLACHAGGRGGQSQQPRD